MKASVMTPARLSAFTDGVLAIVLTIMVLELPVPHGTDLAAMRPLWPILGAYALSFINIGIFWNNHHHLMHLTRKVDGRVLWVNLLLLFWLSLVPFVIRWIGEAKVSPAPVAAYGLILTMAAAAYWLLEKVIILVDVADEGEAPLEKAAAQEGEAPLEVAVGKVGRERLSLLMYAAGAGIAFVQPWLAVAIYAGVALMWFVPDRRVERHVEKTIEAMDSGDADAQLNP
jgi:uncharacterized membrane protein